MVEPPRLSRGVAIDSKGHRLAGRSLISITVGLWAAQRTSMQHRGSKSMMVEVKLTIKDSVVEALGFAQEESRRCRSRAAYSYGPKVTD